MRHILKTSIIVVIILSLLLLILNQFIMRNIKTEVEINASPEKAWNVLMDHPNYNKWNPYILQISGSTELGDYLTVTLKSSNKNTI